MAIYRKLKHYIKYVQDIKALAKHMGIKIKFSEAEDFDGEGVYNPNRRTITIGVMDVSQSEVVALLLHEMGHALDDFICPFSFQKKLSRAYIAEYLERSTRKQNKIVVKCEKRAWKYGKALSQCLGIRRGKWFKAKRKE